jgi:hypothetical protein
VEAHPDAATVFFDYDSADPTSPVFTSTRWIVESLARVGFEHFEVISDFHGESRGRGIWRATYAGKQTPFLYAGEQAT